MQFTEQRIRILSVDDEPRNLRILGELFDGLGEHRKVATGNGAIECLETFSPDVALIDIMLPDIDGYRICEHIRSSGRHPFTKVILVSGKSALDEKLKGYAVGADDYVTKPFVPDELRAKVGAFLRMHELEEKLEEVNRDLEEKVRMRTEQLLRAEKLAWLGTNTAQVLHNLANPIQIIKAQISLMAIKGPSESSLSTLSRNVDKVADIARSILHSTRAAVSVTEESLVDINQVLQEELKLLEANAHFRYDVELELELDDTCPKVFGRATHFHQVFGNLVRNALEATHGCPKKWMRVQSAHENGSVIVRICDSGCGIPPENLARIFNPFFTTKPLVAENDEPTGTGLGLASVRELLNLCGGTIEVASTVGVGTQFTVRIPHRACAGRT